MKPLALLILSVFARVVDAQSITAVTNAALPSLGDIVPGILATIWGSNLADKAVSTAPPWPSLLGGVEVHILIGSYAAPCATANAATSLPCEIPVDLLFVGPTQINFVVPNVSAAAYGQYNSLSVGLVLIRDGQRFEFPCIEQPGSPPGYCDAPGTFSIPDSGSYENPINSASIFIAGYDCLFSLSLTYPSACGFSANPGLARSTIAAVTDLSGNLITSENPVHGGQIVTLWMTGLTGLTKSPTTGLLQQASPSAVGFGLRQYGVFDIPGGAGQTIPMWAGQSPQWVGLDQVNIVFPSPACYPQVTATEERRYDAYLAYGVFSVTGNGASESTAEIYIPFVVTPGELTCQPPPQ
jgi:hypothetical protein